MECIDTSNRKAKHGWSFGFCVLSLVVIWATITMEENENFKVEAYM